jgi:hypothetical protein
MDDSDPTAPALVQAVGRGDTDTLRSPSPKASRPDVGAGSRHAHAAGRRHGLAGSFPNGPQVVRLLIDAGADPKAVVTGESQPGTPVAAV